MVTSTCGVQGLQEAAQAVVLPSVEAAAAAAKYPAGRVCPRDPGGAARRSLVLEVRRRQRVHELGRQGGHFSKQPAKWGLKYISWQFFS